MPLVFVPAVARGVIFYGTGDSTHNTTAPTGSLANAGWQYEIGWKGFLGTPVAPHYFITAAHIDPSASLGNIFFYQGFQYTNVAFSDNSHAKDFGDLRLYRTDQTFYSFAPVYNATADGTELARDPGLVVGKGTQRGGAITTNELKGWNWGATDQVQRWGENKVSGFRNNVSTSDQLVFNFDRTGQGDSAPDEVHVSAGDSGGGIFLNVNGQWKVSGIISSLAQYRLTQGGSAISAALFDTGGLYNSAGTLIPDGTTDVPSQWYANRVSTALASFLPWMDLNPTWNTDAGGDWATVGNWTNNQVPNGVGTAADFRTVINADRVITLSSPKTVGTIDFDSTSHYTISGSTITIDVASGNANINVANGSHTIASNITLNDPTTLRVVDPSAMLIFTGSVNGNGQAITKDGPGTVQMRNVRAGSLTIPMNGGFVRMTRNGGTSKVNALSAHITGAQLDLGNNDLVVDYTGDSPLGSWNGSVYTGLMRSMSNAYDGNAWNHGGIGSSMMNSDHGSTSLGIAEASDVLKLSGTQTVIWSGQTVDATSILIKFTYAGDANLDGRIDIDDYVAIDTNVNFGNSGYSNGDFNYDGTINIDDYVIIDSNVNIQGPPFQFTVDANVTPEVSQVPEPAGIGTVTMAALLLAPRRSRRPRR